MLVSILILPVPLVMRINNGKHWLRLELCPFSRWNYALPYWAQCVPRAESVFFQSILTGFQRLANVDVMKPQKWSDLLHVIGPSAISCCVGVHLLPIRSQIGFTAEYGGSKFIK